MNETDWKSEHDRGYYYGRACGINLGEVQERARIVAIIEAVDGNSVDAVRSAILHTIDRQGEHHEHA